MLRVTTPGPGSEVDALGDFLEGDFARVRGLLGGPPFYPEGFGNQSSESFRKLGTVFSPFCRSGIEGPLISSSNVRSPHSFALGRL